MQNSASLLLSSDLQLAEQALPPPRLRVPITVRARMDNWVPAAGGKVLGVQPSTAAGPSVSGLTLREVMRSYATGVCLATTYHETPEGTREHDAVTVNSFTSVSL